MGTHLQLVVVNKPKNLKMKKEKPTLAWAMNSFQFIKFMQENLIYLQTELRYKIPQYILKTVKDMLFLQLNKQNCGFKLMEIMVVLR